MGLNTLTVEGNVGRDPETKQLSNGETLLSFSLAWSDYRNGKAGPTTWFNVGVFGKYADSLIGKIQKGQKLIVIGRTELKEYTKKDGTKGTSLNLAAQTVRILSVGEHAPDASQKTTEDDGLPW